MDDNDVHVHFALYAILDNDVKVLIYEHEDINWQICDDIHFFFCELFELLGLYILWILIEGIADLLGQLCFNVVDEEWHQHFNIINQLVKRWVLHTDGP